MSTRYDLIVPRPGRDGKTYFTKIGVAFPNKDGKGFSLSFEALPLTDEEGTCRVLMSEPMERDGEPLRQAARGGGNAPPAGAGPIDDDIPFNVPWA